MISSPVVSVGYERRSVHELVEILAGHRVGKLLDVREAPISRRKGFSKTALASLLEDVGIEYLHLRLAGNPYHREKQNIERCLRRYARYLVDNPEVVETFAAELSRKPVAVLCYERQHDNCHRSVLLEAVKRSGHRINVIKVE